MSELISIDENEILVPNEISELWLEEFTNRYGHQFEIELETEDWLEQPANVINPLNYNLADLQNLQEGNWYQKIKGEVVSAAYTVVSRYTDTPLAPMVAIENAYRVLPDGSGEELLAEGRLVLVRLDRLRRNLKVQPYSKTAYHAEAKESNFNRIDKAIAIGSFAIFGSTLTHGAFEALRGDFKSAASWVGGGILASAIGIAYGIKRDHELSAPPKQK